MAGTSTPSWSDIPMELAGLVLRRLPAHVDRVRFAAVCPQWRVAVQEVPPPPPLPLLALPDGTVYSLPGNKPFHLPACVGYKDASSGWLFFSREDGCFLRDPFSNATVTLPPLSRVRVRVRYVGEELGSGSPWMEILNTKDLTLLQVKFCSPHLIAACIRFQGSSHSQIAVCQPGATSWWSMMHLDDRPIIGDLTCHQGKIYALGYCMGDLFSVDISIDHSTGDPWVSQIRQVVTGAFDKRFPATPDCVVIEMLYLVELHDRLLMVRRSMYRRFKNEFGVLLVPRSWKDEIEVFEVDFDQSRWSKVTTFGDDQVLFLQSQCCKFVCVSQYKMQGGRIFFLEDGDEDDMGSGDGDDNWYYDERLGPCRVFDMRDGKVSDPLPMVSWKRGPVNPTWLFPLGQE